MPLLALPNELLLLIASTLPPRDLPSLILTTRRLCYLLTPTLTALARQDHRALHHAVLRGYHDVIQHHLSLGVSPSIADGDNCTALHKAVGLGDEVAVRLLLDHGAALEVTSDGETPLLCAVAGSSEVIVGMLLERGANPVAVGRWGVPPIEVVYMSRGRARRGANWEKRVAEMLVRYGAPKRRVTFDF